MGRQAKEITLEPGEQAELNRSVWTHTVPKSMARGKKVIIWSAEGLFPFYTHPCFPGLNKSKFKLIDFSWAEIEAPVFES
jgi:hypothetical protein